MLSLRYAFWHETRWRVKRSLISPDLADMARRAYGPQNLPLQLRRGVLRSGGGFRCCIEMHAIDGLGDDSPAMRESISKGSVTLAARLARLSARRPQPLPSASGACSKTHAEVESSRRSRDAIPSRISRCFAHPHQSREALRLYTETTEALVRRFKTEDSAGT